MVGLKFKKQKEMTATIEEEKQKLLALSEISLWLDNYDDIFSDFDPRPYYQRALSEDFLSEAKRATRDKVSGSIELKLLIPAEKRNENDEKLIKKRLKEHFKRHYNMLLQEKRKLTKLGSFFVLGGILAMMLATIVLLRYGEKNFLTSFLVVLLEPAGWFLFWEGLHTLIFRPKDAKSDLEFYRKALTYDIHFLPY